ncbi:MAG: extracellular solute-binding protein [Bordetella sp.]|nr:MAG: extracellular solute-binding protein [Bordetella sp.]
MSIRFFSILMMSLAIFCHSYSFANFPEKINLYTTREPKLIKPLLNAFTKETNILVNTIFVKDGLLERVKSEGIRSPADVLMTVDIGNLLDLVQAGITQNIKSEILESVIPNNLRGTNGEWFSLSLRDRVLYIEKDMNISNFNYEDLARLEWKGKVCIRSGQHPYNIALIAAMIAHNGIHETEKWLRDVKYNLARKATGGDRDVARDILGGICDIGLANAYYVGHMKNAPLGSDARKWGDAIRVIRPKFSKSGGTHVNISGAAVAKHSPNINNAIKFLEFLVSEEAQTLYAKINYEHPIRSGIEIDPVISNLGPFKVDTLSLDEIARFRKKASELVDQIGFDN